MGDTMNIAFIEPLTKGWNRMKIALFKPFDLNKWMVVGFNAFLAGLLEGHKGGNGARASENRDFGWHDFFHFPTRVWEWLMDNPGWFIAIIFLTLFLIAVLIVLTWVSSRGKFMFLDNVVLDKAEIAKPWKEYARESNSLFVWRLAYGFIVFGIFLGYFAFLFVGGAGIYEALDSPVFPILFVVGWGLLFLVLAIATGYISLFLSDFVVPIMYKYRLPTVTAWRKFLALFRKAPFQLLLYGLMIFGLGILFVIAVIAAGLMTCCIGILLLIIPYVGTVVTLPIWYTYRAFSLEFLAQFGPEYTLFPEQSGTAPTPIHIEEK